MTLGGVPLCALLVICISGGAAAEEAAPPAVPPSAPTLASAPTSAPAPLGGDGDGPVQFSLPTQTEVEMWRSPGFRLQLGFSYGYIDGQEGAPSGRLLGPVIRVGARTDADWSLLASFQYQSAFEDLGLNGLRFSGTLDPTWHVTDGLELAVGFGLGGFVEGFTGRDDPDASAADSLNGSYTYLKASPPVASCSGVGVAGLVRAGYLFILGPRASSGFTLELNTQYTGCEDDTGRVEPDTAEPIVRRQWWTHLGGSLAWMVSWR